MISTGGSVDARHRRHREIAGEGGRWWWTAVCSVTTASASTTMVKSEMVEIVAIVVATAMLFCVAGKETG